MAKGKNERKGSVSGIGSSGGGHHDEQEQKLQAILLADSFNKHFRPISNEVPKVLCPLVNVPMIDYTLEFLARNEVQEVFVFCVSHARQLEAYLGSCKWGEHMEVRIITSNNCLSAGDALREIDQRGVIRSDPFVLVSGDVISNMDLEPIIQEHKDRKKEDPLTLMTMCFKEAGMVSSARSITDGLVVGFDKATKQIVLFQNNMDEARFDVAEVLLEEHAELEFRGDLVDCHVDICSPEVLVQISDNFDYQDIREHFVSYEAANHELGNRILANLVSDSCASMAVRVHDYRLYHQVSRDIITRWMYPLVPDNATTGGIQTQYTYERGCNYKAPGVNLHRSVRIGNGVVIGADVSIGENSFIDRSVIGEGCRIGADVCVTDSYLWAGAQVEDGARLQGAIVASRAMSKTREGRQGARVKSGAIVPRGCILGPGTVVGEGVQLPEFARMTCGTGDDDEDWGDDGTVEGEDSQGGDDLGSPQLGTDLDGRQELGCLGPDSIGRLWTGEDDDGGDDTEWADNDSLDSRKDPVVIDKMRSRSIGCLEEEEWKRQRWTQFREEEDDLLDGRDMSDDDDVLQVPTIDGTEAFHQVVKDMLENGHQEGHPLDNLLLEIKSYKFAQNREFKECMRPAVEVVLDLAGADSSQGKALVASVMSQFKHWNPLLSKLLVEPGDDVEMIKVVEGYALRSECSRTLRPVFRFVVQYLYEADMVTEDGVHKWIEMRRTASQGSPERLLFEQQDVQDFVDWLEGEEESTEEGDDDDDEDSD